MGMGHKIALLKKSDPEKYRELRENANKKRRKDENARALIEATKSPELVAAENKMLELKKQLDNIKIIPPASYIVPDKMKAERHQLNRTIGDIYVKYGGLTSYENKLQKNKINPADVQAISAANKRLSAINKKIEKEQNKLNQKVADANKSARSEKVKLLALIKIQQAKIEGLSNKKGRQK